MSRYARALMPLMIGISICSFATAAENDAMTLKRVVLSTGGVGYFEYAGEVDGNARVGLDVRRDQVDDVLKSVIVFDDKGGVGSVSLPGQAPLREAFRNLPFTENDMGSMSALLEKLKGAEVQVAGTRQAKGRVMSISEEQQALPGDAGTVTKHRLTLLGEDGFVSLLVEDSDEITFTDERVNQQLAHALGALADYRQQDNRHLTVSLNGKGKREARLAYLAETPVWKSSYRMTLPAKGEQAGMQGWAVLENLSGADWKDVELTLLSGSPSTYRQALYESYFVTRPQAPVVSAMPLSAEADSGAMKPLAKSASVQRARVQADQNAAYGPPRPAPAPVAPLAEALSEPVPAMASVDAAQSQEAASQVEFRLPLPVTLKAGDSLMAPIIDRNLPAEQVAWYQPQTNATHPLASIKLKNNGDTGLPDGLVTLYRRDDNNRVAYVGDARLLPLPVGEERILPYALDQKTRIEKEQTSDGELVSGRIVDGVLQLKSVDRLDTRYRIAAPEREARALIIEQPRQAGYDLIEPKEPAALSGGNWRISVPLAAAESKELLVREEQTREERYQLVDLDRSALLFYAQQTRLSEAQRQALARLAELAAKAEESTQALADRDEEEKRLSADSERLRANLQSIPAGSDAHKRFLERLENAERRLEALSGERTTIAAQRRDAERERDEYLKTLSI